ncbi:biotin--[acetyl-CoA-carboxylase] ligase [Parapedobacter koreensis]|uniref:BirA family transcriptional regulator, biotin operon repressor / biotin-[acetyl-CoA-carboxylase] ligase n=1 Tax=Parapedobacter koreensis TaxID=332977 RepID=A0A1H7QD98_9SPHI|nr:biotin--[acetyl-CoA-carboxylase] ligase [Parapedobacter koreensis]SEL45876.1 BirA family transcriptional regulator, biotin operon repressor / biotin-[acetyl-CoA-carboxylase] ligase [Parapedobacter koreensis]
MQSNTFSGLFDGQNVITLQRTPSTNEFLRKVLTKSTPLAEGTVIMAVDQYAGRGQKGAVWQSEPGKNLTFSLLLLPSFLDPKDQFSLTAAMSLAVAKWLSAMLKVPAKIKWPNDIYIGNKKIGGILIENILKGKTWKSAIVGIGINVNQTTFPDTIRDHATSIKQILHRDSKIPELLAELCSYIEREYIVLKSGDFKALLADYKQRLYRLGELHVFLVDDVEVTGMLTGVTETGRLQIDFNGHMVDFDIKEIAFVI